jgi:hypothetical protein
MIKGQLILINFVFVFPMFTLTCLSPQCGIFESASSFYNFEEEANFCMEAVYAWLGFSVGFRESAIWEVNMFTNMSVYR